MNSWWNFVCSHISLQQNKRILLCILCSQNPHFHGHRRKCTLPCSCICGKVKLLSFFFSWTENPKIRQCLILIVLRLIVMKNCWIFCNSFFKKTHVFDFEIYLFIFSLFRQIMCRRADEFQQLESCLGLCLVPLSVGTSLLVFSPLLLLFRFFSFSAIVKFELNCFLK